MVLLAFAWSGSIHKNASIPGGSELKTIATKYIMRAERDTESLDTIAGNFYLINVSHLFIN